MVFDELDKLDDDGTSAERSPLDCVLGTLKNLFTASGLTFIFVAGKALHDRWLEDLSRGDSVFESVFAHAQYLSGMWENLDMLCDSLAGVTNGAPAGDAPAYEAFRKYLAFRGRGIPRRAIRGFNEFVKWGAAPPRLDFGQADVRRFRFYAGLLDALVSAEEELFGRYRGEGSIEQLDKRRLGIYYATAWILQRQQNDFTLEDLVAASRRMSRLITPVEEAAPAELQRLLDVLVRSEHVERVDTRTQTLVAGVPVPRLVRYRLPRRRLLEFGAFVGVFEQEASIFFKAETPPAASIGDSGYWRPIVANKVRSDLKDRPRRNVVGVSCEGPADRCRRRSKGVAPRFDEFRVDPQPCGQGGSPARGSRASKRRAGDRRRDRR